MISGDLLRRWAARSQEQALANARAAATECSRRRLERAEVDLYLAAYADRVDEASAPEARAGGAAISH